MADVVWQKVVPVKRSAVDIFMCKFNHVATVREISPYLYFVRVLCCVLINLILVHPTVDRLTNLAVVKQVHY